MAGKRNSARWMPILINVSERFYREELNEECIRYKKNKFDKIDEFCDNKVEKLKNEMYPHYINKDVCLLDRHKVVSVYIQGFLKNPIYEKGRAVESENALDLLANEYYCFLALQIIINGWPDNKKAGKKLDIPNDYRDCLLKLFYKYRNSGVLNLEDTTFNYALASIVYFVERCFLV